LVLTTRNSLYANIIRRQSKQLRPSDEQELTMIARVLIGTAGAVLTIGLAAPAGADPASTVGAVPAPPATPQSFLASARAGGVTGSDPAMLADGYDVCWKLWNGRVEGTAVAAGLVRDHPGVTTPEAANFVLAAYHDLCPQPGAYDYWAYSTS
jgi:hypothetical protein